MVTCDDVQRINTHSDYNDNDIQNKNKLQMANECIETCDCDAANYYIQNYLRCNVSYKY